MKTLNLSMLFSISIRVLIESLEHSLVEIERINAHSYEIKTLRHHLNVGTIVYVTTLVLNNNLFEKQGEQILKFEVEFDHEISLAETDTASRESKEFLNIMQQELVSYDIDLEINNETP